MKKKDKTIPKNTTIMPQMNSTDAPTDNNMSNNARNNGNNADEDNKSPPRLIVTRPNSIINVQTGVAIAVVN